MNKCNPTDVSANAHDTTSKQEMASELRYNQKSVAIYPQQTCPSRYVITDECTGTLISDAQGHGYRTFENAYAYAQNQGWVVNNMPAIESTPLF